MKFSKNKDGEDCVVAKKENDNKIKFNDKKCNDDKYFMCKTISDGRYPITLDVIFSSISRFLSIFKGSGNQN